MARITINDVQTMLGVSNTYDIVNAITNSNPATFKQYVPLASSSNIAAVGAGIQVNQTVQNEFLSNLIDRIGKVVIRKVSLQNPLKKFKKGKIPLGRTIEEIFTDLTVAQKYDPFDAETSLYKRTIPNVKTLFHERNRQDFYTQTIGDDQLKTAFTSWGDFGSFVTSIYNALYNSSEVDEYEYMKMLMDNYYAKGLFTMIPVANPVDQTTATAFIKAVRATASRMSLPTGSRDYNSLAVRSRSDMSDLHLIIDATLNAEVDVDVLAKAFNMDRTNFLGNVTVIDGFASTGLIACLVDKDFFQVYDNDIALETIRNPKGRYFNIFYHVWQTLSVSRFQNAVAFVATGTTTLPVVSSVIVDPVIAQLKAGTSSKFTAYVRSTDGSTNTPTWAVAASTAATTLQAGTTIAADGTLTIASNQTGELLVTATVAGKGIDIDGAGPDTADVVGQSIVTVV